MPILQRMKASTQITEVEEQEFKNKLAKDDVGICNIIKCKITWFEFKICENETEEKEYLTSLPDGSRITGHSEAEGGTEFECVDTFEAKNINEAKKKIKEDYYEVEIFTVLNAETGERLFTEEDIENEDFQKQDEQEAGQDVHSDCNDRNCGKCSYCVTKNARGQDALEAMAEVEEISLDEIRQQHEDDGGQEANFNL